MKSILCVIDVSKSSIKVLQLATSIALTYKVPLIILGVYRAMDYNDNDEYLRTAYKKEVKEKFELLKNKALLLDLIHYEFYIESGYLSNRIHAYVKKELVNTIIISQRLSNTIDQINPMALQDLIARIKVPFMIVPQEADIELYSNHQKSIVADFKKINPKVADGQPLN
jgi:hypothetical protein